VSRTSCTNLDRTVLRWQHSTHLSVMPDCYVWKGRSRVVVDAVSERSFALRDIRAKVEQWTNTGIHQKSTLQLMSVLWQLTTAQWAKQLHHISIINNTHTCAHTTCIHCATWVSRMPAQSLTEHPCRAKHNARCHTTPWTVVKRDTAVLWTFTMCSKRTPAPSTVTWKRNNQA